MKIQDLLKQSKPCWKYAAMSHFKKWYCYTEKPELGLKYRTICKIIASGWDTEKALTTPKIVGRPKNK